MNPVPHGEPYAGKLHVRFDEGYPPKNGEARFEGSRRPSGRTLRGRPALLYTLLDLPYDGKGRLITEPPGAGTPDKVSYDGNKHSWRNSHYWGHGLWDWLTYKILSYDMYFKHWPPNNGNNCPKNSGNK